jgi:15-cis-phytoene synthase
VRDPLVERCQEIIRRGSKSFAVAARLFDPRTRAAAYLLYAWCRYCDDAIDGETLGFRDASPREGREAQLARLEQLRAATHAALEGRETGDPVFAALRRVVQEHSIPHVYPLELLEGFAMDVEGRRYETLHDVFSYCYHVAGVVGLMMSHVMGVRDEAMHRRAADLGIALQLTNIARDVLEDASVGRVYLPLSWLRISGVEPDELADPRHRDALASCAACLLGEAELYYASADLGIERLPFRSAWAVAVARGVYKEIGSLVLARGRDAWESRCVVSSPRKSYWLARGLGTAIAAVTLGRRRHHPPRRGLWTRGKSLDETAF